MKIQIKLTTFYTTKDEARLFMALRDISALKSMQGIDRSLQIDFDLRKLSRDSVFELIGILTRYQIDLKPLSVLAERSKLAWIKDKKWYWHVGMFGEQLL
ncbi:hypothetical protein ACO0K9_27660 [Undibacterium sp. Ji50W]|uniref:hypothetical protein n=1 Tax=Undibacterium sp. Ji50W TaxID=3413041 RepID=UPI003BF00B0B